MREEMRSLALQTRLAVYENQVPRLTDFRSNDYTGFRKLLGNADMAARDVNLDVGVLRLPRNISRGSLAKLVIIDPTTSVRVTRCRHAACNNLAFLGVYCWKHQLGPKRLAAQPRANTQSCQVAGCRANAVLGHYCPKHLIPFRIIAATVRDRPKSSSILIPNTVKAPAKRTGTFESISVDYNVHEHNQYGMRIHVNLTVQNLKGAKCRAVAYFEFASGITLKDYNEKYRTTNGSVAVGTDLAPGYDNTVYNDLTLFMPYSELHLAKGQHHLRFKIDVYEQMGKAHFMKSQYVYFSCNL
jgi:hypothetical protein